MIFEYLNISENLEDIKDLVESVLLLDEKDRTRKNDEKSLWVKKKKEREFVTIHTASIIYL